jgi:dihydrodipicolinate reductase
VDRSTIPYGLTSPDAGTVDATVDTCVSGAMNAVGVVVTAGVLAVVAAVLDGLVVLLELPHPATASAASGTAKIIFFLLT